MESNPSIHRSIRPSVGQSQPGIKFNQQVRNQPGGGPMQGGPPQQQPPAPEPAAAPAGVPPAQAPLTPATLAAGKASTEQIVFETPHTKLLKTKFLDYG